MSADFPKNLGKRRVEKFEESEYFSGANEDSAQDRRKEWRIKGSSRFAQSRFERSIAMHLQMYFTAFTANVKRIVRLEELAME